MQYFHIEEYLSIMKTNNAIAIYILNILWIAGEIQDILNYTQDIIHVLFILHLIRESLPLDGVYSISVRRQEMGEWEEARVTHIA